MHTEHFIVGKDASLESSISTMQARLEAIGFHVEERSWLSPVDGVWSGMSEIYQVDDLEYENNSVGNDIREAILHLPELDDEECADLIGLAAYAKVHRQNASQADGMRE